MTLPRACFGAPSFIIRGGMSDATPPASPRVELQRSLGFPGVLGQSIAGESPTATPAMNIALVFLAVGSGSWIVFAVATLAILLVACNLVPMARTGAGAGSLSDFIARGLGEPWRVVGGWLLLLTYLATGVAVLAACVDYATSLLGALGGSVPPAVLVAGLGGLASFLALRNVRLSTGVMLGFELLSIALVLLLCVAVLVRQGLAVDVAAFRPAAVSFADLNGALLIGILSFAGFETAAGLGDEAKDPLRTIPRALLLTPALTGLFFVVCAYVLVLGFHRYDVDVAGSNAPLDVLADRIERPGLGILISFGASISLFACTVATLVAVSRVAFSLARQGALPAFFGAVNPRHFLPRNAVFTAVAVVLGLGIVMALRAKPMDIYDWFGTFATFGFASAYLLTCVGTPLFLRRQGALRKRHVAASVAAVAVLLYVLGSSVYPAPAAPLNLLPWIFLALLAAGVAFSWNFRRPAARG